MQAIPQAATGWKRLARPRAGTFVMAVILLTLGFYLLGPVVIIFSYSFNVARDALIAHEWGLENWQAMIEEPRLLGAVWNSFFIWAVTAACSFPFGILIAWALARVRLPFAYALEFMFWVGYITPGGAIAWILLLDPTTGIINSAIRSLPFVNLTEGPFNIFSVTGIIFTGMIGNGLALMVMILTPVFRNMDSALEEAARVGGASNLRTMLRVTLPLMISPIVLLFALQLLRIFQSFETEFLLGRPIDFFVYSTLVYEMVEFHDPPLYGRAAALSSITMLIILAIIPLQRWIVTRRHYTTISGSFRPGLIDLGPWKWAIFGFLVLLHLVSTIMQTAVFVLGSFMTRAGLFFLTPTFTLDHWAFVLQDRMFVGAIRTTFILAMTTAVISPILFSMLAYILVRTKWPGKGMLDSTIWISAALPGLMSGLGLLLLFLDTPGLSFLYGSIWALILVIVLQGKTTGVNLSKAPILQVGLDMEDAARISGAGWWRTYFKVWIPILLPTMILLGTLNFVSAAGATSSIILLASRETITLSILALEFASPEVGMREAASIAQLIITVMTLGVALIAHRLGLPLGIRHETGT